MKTFFYIAFFLFGMLVHAQTALYNSGNIRIHDQGQLGFHTDLINDAAFDENVGLAGFYGEAPVTVLGAFAPTFYDMEIANATGVVLQTGINNLNNTNFIVGDFLTAKNQSDTYYNFLADAFYVGDGDISHVDGYAAVTGQSSFTFPIGDGVQLRSLILNSQSGNPLAKCAYFFENPTNPSSISGSFNTAIKSSDLGGVCGTEFWRLEGSVPSTVQISWNERTNIAALTDDVSTLRVVGWSKATDQWVPLGPTGALGDLTNGFAVSDSFVPEDYEAITFGTLDVPGDFLDLENYFVSANGDGINDALIIPELSELSPNNHLKIYNRFGSLVFEQENYTDQFRGYSNVNNFVIDRGQGLPADVYFYIVSMDDLGLDFQGFLYLTR
ncbi:gliding motility-associated C-terminal domain-containing protein [Maribacter polysaccharolyticus]|uniref:gliding motility-associated C-terminal domain-containing protein n=1 Tax=Maribacter polysaccharolyticus TaxID=3020831 RepID=UPI00237F38B7|nr:gliding motility-associated C-terminal domain-containing protein [Maribacter polysaccharolyticus]MDE3743889.1 gliding motility-associated C-terminal domain-containing protein [Maribacter polysaccharolyticus]